MLVLWCEVLWERFWLFVGVLVDVRACDEMVEVVEDARLLFALLVWRCLAYLYSVAPLTGRAENR